MPSKSASSMAGNPSGVAGILIIRFGRSTSPQYMRACSSVPSVSCARRGATSSDTEGTLEPARLLVDRPQDVGGELDVAHREPAVDLPRGEALLRCGADVVVVVGGAEDRLLEDRRVRRDAAQRV